MGHAQSARWLGLVALLPLSLDPSLLVARDGIAVPLCSADGTVRSVEVPLGPARLPGENPAFCCGKACHTGGTRKRNVTDIDPAQ